MKLFCKILIANRGEVASRIIRTCRDMNIDTVAVFSDADAKLPYTWEASQAVALGGNTPRESYLDIDKILTAAQKSSADAIHPGFGFLSENAVFAKRVAEAGFTFIGPTPDAMAAMGSKIGAKEMMKKAGVPIIPGYQGDDQNIDVLIKEAKKVGLPCLIKASAGGGGKGLKRCLQESDIRPAIESASREALSAFGDATLLIEKYIQNPRHIEVQIFGDTHGNIIHLWERECTLQRRHQKVVEEAPSSFLTEKTRGKITMAAIKAAQSVNYTGAGTVEFVVDPHGEFYFLEMNTRLQVEHPVTEMITGLDLVRLQIEVAQGLPLSITQKDVVAQGHSMEVRLYAEDPAHDFLPTTGRIFQLELPQTSGIRYEMGLQEGDEVSVYYDPMLGKIIAHDQNRVACMQKLAAALRQIRIFGSTTNLGFLTQLITHPDHVAGHFDTDFIERHLKTLCAPETAEQRAQDLIAATLFTYADSAKRLKKNQMTPMAGFRNAVPLTQKLKLKYNTMIFDVAYRVDSAELLTFTFWLEGQEFSVSLDKLANNSLWFSVNGLRHHFTVAQDHSRDTVWIHNGTATQSVTIITLRHGPSTTHTHGELTAPLPGKILKIFVKNGDAVKAGDPLMIVEAMKMEHPIKANQDGIIAKLYYNINDLVKLGDVLAEIS